MKKQYKIIGFDADDTLWINEPYFQETEKHFCHLLSDYNSEKIISQELFKVEMKNLELYGYGAKGFVLSMIETAQNVSDHKIPVEVLSQILKLGKELLNKPLVLLDGIREVIEYLDRKNNKLIVLTKGDLLDQERKLEKSAIQSYFHHIEVMSDKKEDNYLKILSHLDIKPSEFLMVGNSMKSDILPVVNIGGYGIHVPYHTTWEHEKVEQVESHAHFKQIDHISELLSFL